MQQPREYNFNNNQRQTQRVTLGLPIQISYGSQITIQGMLKDLSLKSAFIIIKNSIYMQMNDEVSFAILRSPQNTEVIVQGMARISRISPGEGIAIYFTKMDENSTNRLKEIVVVP